MAEKKFYAVKNGRKPGVYDTWDECKLQVDGFSGAKYKGFKTEQEAMEFVYGNLIDSNLTKEQNNKVDSIIMNKGEAIAYVDGSFNAATNIYGSGVIVLYNSKEIVLKSCGCDVSLVKMRNIAGEIKAAEMAMQWAIDNNISVLHIYHDYTGIAEWCVGGWKKNEEGTKAYSEFYKNASKLLDISFHKVEGHSGVKYNELVDRVAKDACGIK